MHNLKKFFIFLFAIFFYSSYVLSVESTIFFIDLDYLLKNSNLGKNILKDLDDLNKKNINLLKKDEEKLKKIDDEITNTKNVIKKDELEKKVLSFRNEIKIFEEKKKNFDNEFLNSKTNKLNDFMNKISPIIQNYMKDNSITILLDKKNIFIGASEYDITENVILIIDQNFK